MATKVTSTLVSNWLPDALRIMNGAAAEMATDIHRRASMNAPKASSALVKSGHVVRKGNGHFSVVFGGDRVPYAKLRHYVNKKNPQTIGYLERAGDSVVRGNVTKYIRT